MLTYEFILPQSKVARDAAGRLTNFETKLALTFGGYTKIPATGTWYSPLTRTGPETEAVFLYRVTMLPSERPALLALVLDYARKQGEKALYFGTAAEAEIYLTGN